MSVGDFDSRETATTEFLKRGLGAKLTNNAQALMRGLAVGAFPHADRWAIRFACGSIIERVLWQATGIWIGYFDTVQPVSDEEKKFLSENAGLLTDLDLPEWFQELSIRLGYLDSTTERSFYTETLSWVPLGRHMPEWFSTFQACLIASELLDEPSITSFLLFLQRGNIEKFEKHRPDPNAVFSHLQDQDVIAPFYSDSDRPEPVLAGFIRYTQFLSALDGIFPDLYTGEFAETSNDIPVRIVDRDILFSFLTQYRWRFPKQGFERYQAVVAAFVKLTATEFARHPGMGVQWFPLETLVEIARLSRKFFLEPQMEQPLDEKDPLVADETQRRRQAYEQRIAMLRKEGSEGSPAAFS